MTLSVPVSDMNESDPLSQLRDIHLPPAVGDWPPAPGWWLLAFLVIGFIVAVGMWLVRRHRRRAWRREALAVLPDPKAASRHDIAYYSELNQLLKRAARVCCPGAGTDGMSGESWRSFLQERAPNLPAEDLSALTRAPFQREAEISPDAAHRVTRDWLRSQQC